MHNKPVQMAKTPEQAYLEKKAATTSNSKEMKEHALITLDTKTTVSNTYTVYMDNFIGEPNEYRSLTEFLRKATKDDTFELIMNGPGGYCDACAQIVHAIANTEAKVIGHLMSEVHSAHSNIFMACHEHVIYPYSVMMVHTFSGGFYGKGHDSERASKAFNKLTRNLYTDLYTGFLTEEELEDVLVNNQDLHFVGQEIQTRMQGRYEYIDMMNEEYKAQAEADAEAELAEICKNAGACVETPTYTEDLQEMLDEIVEEVKAEEADQSEDTDAGVQPEWYPEDNEIDPSV